MYKISDIRKVFSLKGTHAAFTDITTFKGNYYLGFMIGVKHMVDDENKSIILKSQDGESWTPSCIFHCEMDTREPKFTEIDGKLFAYFFTITPSKDKTRMLTDSWFSYTSDGLNWSKPEKFAIEEKFWRPVHHKGTVYCVSHPKDPAPDRPCKLNKSTDGMKWDHVSDIPIDPMQKPNEASLAFDSKGDLYIFIRSDMGSKHSYVLKSSKPYVEYEVFDMGRQLGGPLIWADNDEIYLGARFFTKYGSQHTGIFKLEENMKPEIVCVLPSFGDCSYMGITKKISGEGYFASYYSSHECLKGTDVSPNIASIYIAEILKT